MASPPTMSERRHDARITGPFEGHWHGGSGANEVRISDMSLGGCFVNSMNPQRIGVRLLLKIDLPHEGTIQVMAESLYQRPGGFAVHFVDVDIDTARRLARTVDALRDQQTPST